MNMNEPLVTEKKSQKFMKLAKMWAEENSKDPSSKIGAVAVDPKTRRVIDLGYNGFPEGIDDKLELYEDRVYKNKTVIHAEMNVVYNAAKHGKSLSGAWMYVYGLPMCRQCALGMIQSGVKKVIIEQESLMRREDWKRVWFEDTLPILLEAKIEVEVLIL